MASLNSWLSLNYAQVLDYSNIIVGELICNVLGGSLVDLLQARTSPFEPDIVTSIFYQTCRAVAHMHSQVPAIVHRDLKIENLLISAENTVKLCDFGSATTEIFRPDLTWSANQHSSLEDNVSIPYLLIVFFFV